MARCATALRKISRMPGASSPNSRDPAYRSTRSRLIWSRMASSCLPTPPTGFTARSRTSVQRCSAAGLTDKRWRSEVTSAKPLRRLPKTGARQAKSAACGSTTEPNVMKDYFFAQVSKAIGADKAGHRFIAVTDPGSSLEKVATRQGFARIFHGAPAIGGRYSVLSPFGLVPAATAGINLRALLKHALAMVRSCGPDVPPHENPGVQLGLAMGH